MILLRSRRWMCGLAAAAIVTQAGGCIVDLNTFVNTGLASLTTAFASSIVTTLLSDLLNVSVGGFGF